MNLSYYLSDEGKEDLIKIYDYGYDNWGEIQADQYHDNMHDTFQLLGENPKIGRIRHELGPGLRSFPYQAHVIFYMEWELKTVIARVLHGAKDFDAEFKDYNSTDIVKRTPR